MLGLFLSLRLIACPFQRKLFSSIQIRSGQILCLESFSITVLKINWCPKSVNQVEVRQTFKSLNKSEVDHYKY